MKHYITRQELAEQTKTSISYWAQMAMNNSGPKYRVIGRKALYDQKDVDDWIDKPEISAAPQKPRKIGRPRKGRPRKQRSVGV